MWGLGSIGDFRLMFNVFNAGLGTYCCRQLSSLGPFHVCAKNKTMHENLVHFPGSQGTFLASQNRCHTSYPAPASVGNHSLHLLMLQIETAKDKARTNDSVRRRSAVSSR